MPIRKDKVIDILKQCYDPEILIDLWNLGLIYNIEIDNSDKEGMSDNGLLKNFYVSKII